MSLESRSPFIRTEPFVHPRQNFLVKLLEIPDLPEGADQLIHEAIAEYDGAYGKKPEGSIGHEGKSVNTMMRYNMEDDGEEGELFAGKSHTLTVKFGDEEPEEEVMTYVAVTVHLDNLHDVKLYPDWIRRIGIDAYGNSRKTDFLLEVPESLSGRAERIKIECFNGSSLAMSGSLPVKFI